MSNRIRTLEDRWRVSFLVNNYKAPEENGDEKDIRVPKCQREWAWKNKRGLQKQQSFIDSVMNGYPVPTCILNRTHLRQFEIYDGRHRIETLYRYANDRFAWNNKKYSEISDTEKDRFNDREIPVTIMEEATSNQLADVFIRLNKGVPLKDYDLFWANRNTPLVSAVERLVFPNERLSKSLGGIKLNTRVDLSHWVALVHGLNTENAGNISTSYIRASDNNGMYQEIHDNRVINGLNAVVELYERANDLYPANDTEKRRYKKVGKITAFFVSDWLNAIDKNDAIQKWVHIIGRLRGENRDAMTRALTTSGAQNLTCEKIDTVIKQVDNYLTHGISEDFSSIDDEDDDE